MAFLFGDILAVGVSDLAVIWGGAAAVIALISWRWDALLIATMSPELARAGGLDPEREQLVLSVTLAIVVAVALKVVGVILITALLIIPAAAARPLARTPEAMALIAALIASLAAIGGLQMSLWADTPAGPSIVTVAFCIFIASLIAASWRRSRR
jgi:zinc transport system permease protein